MLNFRNTGIFLLALTALLVAAGYLTHPLPKILYSAPLAVYGLLLVYGSCTIGSGFYCNVLCGAPTDRKVIALSFDDGPSAAHTPRILEILQRSGTEAAFFCIGKRVDDHPALAGQIHREGHLIGNHSYSHHFWFDLFSSRAMRSDMGQADSSIEKATGLRPRLFRPPYGVTNPNLARAIRRGGYIPVGWNVRSLDTVAGDPEKLLARVLSRIRPGAVVLFHDTSGATAGMLEQFIGKVKSDGYQVMRLDKMLNLSPYA